LTNVDACELLSPLNQFFALAGVRRSTNLLTTRHRKKFRTLRKIIQTPGTPADFLAGKDL
jgi:hypothetical protein